MTPPQHFIIVSYEVKYFLFVWKKMGNCNVYESLLFEKALLLLY